MIENELKKAWAMEQSLDILDEQMERLAARAKHPTVGDNAMERNTVGYMTLIAKLCKDKDELYQKLAYIDECINLVKDPVKREILRARYVCKLSRKATAKKFHYTEVRISQLTNEALEELNKRLHG